MSWFSVFLYLWAAGISGALALVPPAEFGRRFFKVHGAILLVLATVATLVGRPLMGGFPSGSLRLLAEVVAWVLVVDVFLIAGVVFSGARRIVPVAFMLPVITGAMLALAVALDRSGGRAGGAALLTVHLAAGGALLGSVLVAMNLGHAYLQDSSMSFDHLVRLAKLFLGSVVAKTIASAALLAPEAGRWWPQLLDSFDGMLIAVRVVAGLAGVLVLALMVLSCAKARANQSATGILYAAVVFVLVGESISFYLTLGRGIGA